MKFYSLLATAAVLCVWQNMHAETPGVAIIKADGSSHTVEFAALHRIDIGAGTVTVHHTTADPVTHSMADIERIEIGADVSGIADITAAGDMAVWPTVATDVVNVAGAKAYTSIKVYDLNGRVAARAQANAEGAAQINVSALTAGTYVVAIDGHSVKIIKK